MEPQALLQGSCFHENCNSGTAEFFKFNADNADNSVLPQASPCGHSKSQEESENLGSSGSWLRVRARDDELKKYFELPATENLMDDFHCALRKRILLQGRMYVFDRYVCFYSNVLGFVKKRVIELKDVANVKKKTHLRFPNSIEIEVRGQRRDFYTSFLSRDDAFTLIFNAWQQSRVSSPDGDPSASTRRTSSSVRRALSHGSAVMEGQLDGKLLDGPVIKRQTEGIEGIVSRSDSGDGGNCPSYETDDGGSDRDEEEEDMSLVWRIEDMQVPDVPKTCKLLVAVELHCSVRDFFDRIMSNDSHFFEDFHSTQGDLRILLTSWRADEQMGHVRELQFVSPIKSAFANWGTSHTQCHQTQRFVVYPGDHVLFESSQVMTDIPYGDHFSVDTRWDVLPCAADPTHCSIKIYMHCVFTKKCMFRSIIESGSFKQTQEMFQLFFQQVKQAVSKPKPLTAINIRDKSFVSPQSRNCSVTTPATPKERPASPSHANNPSTSFSRPPCVAFNQAASSRTDQRSCNQNTLANGTSVMMATPPRIHTSGPPQDLLLQQTRPSVPTVLHLPPRGRSVSISKELPTRKGETVQVMLSSDTDDRSLLRYLLGGIINPSSNSHFAMSILVALNVIVLLLLLLGRGWLPATSPAEPQPAPALQRLAVMQQEVKLLQMRLELVTAEMAALAQQLGDGVAAAAAAALQ